MCNQELKNELYNKLYNLKDGRELIIREPEVRDAQALIDYMKEVDTETRFLAREPGEFGFTVEQEEAFINNLLEDNNIRMMVAEVDGVIIANCSVGIVMNKLRYLHRAALGVSVKREYWRMGIGRILMNECISWCKEKDVEQLELEVVTDNERAFGMYQSLGFEICGTKKHALKYSDGTYADEYFMTLYIKND